MPRIRRIKRRRPDRSHATDPGVNAVLPSRFNERGADGDKRVVVVGNPIFNLKMGNIVKDLPGVELAAVARTAKDALAFPTEHGAELVIVDVDFGGAGQGVSFARDINQRSTGAAFLLVCGAMTPTTSRALWVYGTNSWSVISPATAKNPDQLIETIKSAILGRAWVEPGIQREIQQLGPRPKSLAERKLAVFEQGSRRSA